jgi:peptidyl-prolyl cis-trans isomerase SurA
MIKKTIRYFLFFGLITPLITHLFLIQASLSKESDKLSIAAVVNDKIISINDLKKRVHLITVISPIQKKPSIDKYLKKRVLNQLIDEELERQETSRLNITISQREIDIAKRLMERRFRLKKHTLGQFITKNKIDEKDVLAQIETSLAWTRAVQRRFVNYLKISDEEIDDVISRLNKNIGRKQLRVSEIFLPIDEKSNEQDIRELAFKLYQTLLNGTDFSKIAKDFSTATSAKNDGKIGWIFSGQLAPELDRPLHNLKNGQITVPIRTRNGFYILKLDGRRELKEFDVMKTKVSLLQTLIPLPTSSDSRSLKTQARNINNIVADVKTCQEVKDLSKSNKSYVTTNLGELFIGELSPKLKKVVISSRVGIPSKPIRLLKAISLVTVCKRIKPPSNIPNRKVIERQIQGSKLETMARKYLRDLRRNAFVEKRL